MALSHYHYFTVLLMALVALSGIYSLFALFCILEFFRPEEHEVKDAPGMPISVLKPLSGNDPELYENIQSFCSQDYAGYEILMGVTDPDDTALTVAETVVSDFSEWGARASAGIVVSRKSLGTNRKVSNLGGLVQAARYPLIAISDSDMRVDNSYLRRIAQEYFSGNNTGLVTSLYKISRPLSVGAALESLTMALDLIPSVLVARRLEGVTFGLGASMLLSKEALAALGGCEAVADYLADDYQIGNRLWRKGYTIILSRYVLEATAGAMSLPSHLKHQLRWARTYKACRPKGFFGYGITYIFPIACLLLMYQWRQGSITLSLMVLGAALALRLCLALVIYRKVIRSRKWLRWLILVPLKDILSFCIWIGSFFGSTVSWRGNRYQILKEGRIRSMP